MAKSKKSPAKKKPAPKAVTVRDARGRDLGVHPCDRVRKLAPNARTNSTALIVPDAAAFLSAVNSGKPVKREAASSSAPKPAQPPSQPKPKPAPKPKPTSLESRLLNWAAEIAESSRPDIGQRLTAQALASKQAAIFSFNKAARTAGRSWSRAFEGRLPYPVTVVELPNYADIDAVALATDSAGCVWSAVIGSRNSAPDAIDEAKRLVQFVVDTCTQHVTSGGHHVAISHVVEMCHTHASTVSSIPLTSNPPTKPRSSGKGKPHTAAKKHHVRGHWRLQRVGEGRQQVRRVWVGEHMRGGHTFAYSNSERCPAGFYQVRMA